MVDDIPSIGRFVFWKSLITYNNMEVSLFIGAIGVFIKKSIYVILGYKTDKNKLLVPTESHWNSDVQKSSRYCSSQLV